MTHTSILGIRINILSKKEALNAILHLAQGSTASFVTTVNPEQIYDSWHNLEFRKFLNKSSLSLCDGTGVLFASYLFPPYIKERITGSGITPNLLEMAKDNGLKVQIILKKDWVISRQIVENYLINTLKINKNNIIVTDADNLNSNANITFICDNHLKAWKITELLLSKLQRGVVINVGGTFDYILGIQKKPSNIIRLFGLEWLYRFMTRPAYRFKRVFKAIILFPLLVLSTKISLTLFRTQE